MKKPVFNLPKVYDYEYRERCETYVNYDYYLRYESHKRISFEELINKAPKDLSLDKIYIDVYFDDDERNIQITSDTKIEARPEQFLKDKEEYGKAYKKYMTELQEYNIWKKENNKDKDKRIKELEEELAELKK